MKHFEALLSLEAVEKLKLATKMLKESPKSATVLLIAFGMLLVFQFISILKRAYLTPLRAVPGPWYAKWTRLWLKWKIICGQRTQYIHGLHQTYGQYVRIAPLEIATSDLVAHQTIYGPGSKFHKADWYKAFDMGTRNEEVLGALFSITDPKIHSERRRLFSNAFSNSSIMSKEPIIRSMINTAVEKCRRDARAHGSTDIMKWWVFMTSDILAALSFGESFGLLEQEKKTQYVLDSETSIIILGLVAEFTTLFKLLFRVPIPMIQQMLNVRDRVDSYGVQAIRNHKRLIGENPEVSISLLAGFLDPNKHKIEISENQLAREAGNLIVAGSETTATSLTYLTYALLRPCNKDVRNKLMAEIAPLPVDAPAKDILALPYLKQVIEENLRLYAVTGGLPRVIPTPGMAFSGYFLPAGTEISTQPFTLQHDPRTFTNVESFQPERWESPTQDMKIAWSPFSIGPRTCLGLHLALFEITCAIFTFLKKCPSAEIAPNMTDEDMEFNDYFVLKPKGHRLELTIMS